MNFTAIGDKVYRKDDGSFWVRPLVRGKRTWRKLASNNAKEAREEASEVLRAEKLASLGVGQSPFATKQLTAEELCKFYVDSGCPNMRLEAQSDIHKAMKVARLVKPIAFFGKMAVAELRMKHAIDYTTWRMRQGFRMGDGASQVDAELDAFSSVITYGVLTGRMEQNYLRSGRPRQKSAKDVRHCRDCMPESGDELNRIASCLFDNPETEGQGWAFVFLCLTGLRKHELLTLRVDARTGEPGYVHTDRLDVYRGKGGINPWVVMHSDLASAIQSFHVWRAERGVKSPFWASRMPQDELLSPRQINGAIDSACASLGLPKRSPHGCRAFYVTKWRRDGYSDSDVASMIGDQTVGLIHSVYGRPRPGEAKLSFRPTQGLAAWERWILNDNVLAFEPKPSQENEYLSIRS